MERPPPDYYSGSSSSSRSSAPSSIHSSDVIAPIYPLGELLSTAALTVEQAGPFDGSSFRHLPHLTSSTLALSLAKPSIQVLLTQNPVFVSPPPRDAFGLAPRDYGQDREEDGGKDAQVSGFVNVVAPTRRLVKGLKIELIGQDRLAFPVRAGERTGESLENQVFYSRSLVVDAPEEGLWLEKGVSTWEFSFTIPKTSPVSERASCSGRVQYSISATVSATPGWFQRDLVDTKEVCVACNPSTETNLLQLAVDVEARSPLLGLAYFGLQANQAIVSAPFHLTLILVAPPPTLTIFAVQCYIVQTAKLISLKDPSRTVEVKGPRRWILRPKGNAGGHTSEGYVERMRAKGVVFDGTEKSKQRDGEFWKYMAVLRMPNEEEIRSTTMAGTDTRLRFKSRFVCEIICNKSMLDSSTEKRIEGPVGMAALYEKEIFVGSCCCTLPSLTLPGYNAKETVIPLRPKEGDAAATCMCSILWENLKNQELDLMRQGCLVLSADGLEVRRRGGTADLKSFDYHRWVTVQQCPTGLKDRGLVISLEGEIVVPVAVGVGRKVGEAY